MKVNQITNTVFMVRPSHFCSNTQTISNNHFQQVDAVSKEDIQQKAIGEFNNFVNVLQKAGVRVIVFEDNTIDTPDSLFPNNWITTHEDGSLILYPMFAKNRRKERANPIIDSIKKNFRVSKIHNLAPWETQAYYLEGTGSMVLDRLNQIAYAALSERTSERVLNEFCKITGFHAVTFYAYQSVDTKRLPIYHTNVMMSVSEHFAVVCTDCIDDPLEQIKIEEHLKKTKKTLIRITENQLSHFAGNILTVKNSLNETLIIMSSTTYQIFTAIQRKQLGNYGKLIEVPIPTIERYGGGWSKMYAR